MATSTNTFKTRVQLKSDTEEHWNLAGPKEGSAGFVPLLGELIVYTADATHHFSRLKVGDGNTNVVDLPFIDSGTINGSVLPEANVVMYQNTSSFPQPGQNNKLYIDLSTGIIYCFNVQGYTQLSNFTYNIEKTSVSSITYWNGGSQTRLSCEKGILKAATGIIPSLNYETVSVVRNISKEETTV